MASFKPNMNIKSVDHFQSLSCTPHIALTMDLSFLCKIPISKYFQAPLMETQWKNNHMLVLKEKQPIKTMWRRPITV